MPKFRFDHVHLYSPDPVKAADFYVQMFGAEKLAVRQESAEHTVVELILNGIKIIVSRTLGITPSSNLPIKR